MTGETVLLGRGGSDTSAALFAARLQAQRCEIWTDVPGVYTSNPRDIPDARLLRLLDYDEAQEIASAGAGVLHPRCLGPVRRYDIPLHVRCTPRPELPGTVISSDAPQTAEVKVITARRITLVSMSSLGMWQNAGFWRTPLIASRCTESASTRGTSETNVTASFDPAMGVIPEDTSRLLEDLNQYCSDAHSTLCGGQYRSSHSGYSASTGPALEVFESQNSSGESSSQRFEPNIRCRRGTVRSIGSKLHTLLFGDDHSLGHLGPTWKETFDSEKEAVTHSGTTPWWHTKRQQLISVTENQTPAFVCMAPPSTVPSLG